MRSRLVRNLEARSDKGLAAAERLLTAESSGGAAHVFLDLAAVRFSRSIIKGNAEEAVGVLELLERAETAGADPGAVRFNRARVLHHLGLWRGASEAYRRLLAVEPSSPWSDEARSLLAMIEAEAATLHRRRAARAPEWHLSAGCDELFERSTDEVFSQWLDARDAGAEAERLALEAELAAAGGRLRGACQDGTVARLADEVHDASGRQVSGWRHYRAGRQHFEVSRYAEARDELQRATAELDAGSSIGSWAQLWLAGTETYDGAYPAVLERLGRLRTTVGPLDVPRLRGRIEWNVGLVQTRSGRRDLGTASYLEAERWLASAGFGERTAGIRVLLAENLSTLGFEERAWSMRIAALRELQRTPWHFTLHNVLIEAARSASRAKLGSAFALIIDEARSVAEAWGGPDKAPEVEQWAARGHLELGQRAAAVRCFRASRRMIEDLDDSYDKRFLHAFALLGELKADPGMPDGLGQLAAVRAWLGDERAAMLLDALRLEAVIHGQEGNPDAAREALERALTLVHEVRRDEETTRRDTAWEAIQDVFDEAMRFEMDGGNGRQALLLLEDARSSVGLDAQALEADLGAWGRADATSAGGNAPALLVFALLDDRIVWWLLDESRSSFGAVDPRGESLVRTTLAEGGGQIVWSRDVRERLFEALLAPALTALPATRDVVIVPDRDLFMVPFAALVDVTTGRAVVHDRVIGLSSSLRRALDAQSAMGAPIPAASVFVVANPAVDSASAALFPDLGGSEEEAAGVARQWPGVTTVAHGPDATPERIREGIEGANIVHLATHAVRTRSGRRVLLALAPGQGGATAYTDLADLLPRRPDLLVLSSCASGRLGGDRAGAPWPLRGDPSQPSAVVATLWLVDDAKTAEFMVRFHARLAAGVSARNALALIQRSYASEDADDLAWAAFQVFEDVRFERAVTD